MADSQHDLNVYLDKNKIAIIKQTNDQLSWDYTQSWLQTGFPVSPHLPLENEIPTLNVQRFLRNLLPEGGGLDVLLSYFRLSRYNTFGLVQALGLDMPGSLVFLNATQSLPSNASFRAIHDDEIEQRLSQRDEYNLLVWDEKPRLSVAGVQDKINIVLNDKKQLGFGEGSLCSTHLLKFEKQAFSHLVLNEYLTMQLAKQCGLNVANVELIRYGPYPALLVERFDREFISISEVKRYHIIDGCQALNLSPEYKYERNFGSGRDVAHIRDGVNLKKLFKFVDQCINPAVARQQLLDWVLFNLLVFNYDAHGKNISFYVDDKGIKLAPFYDLVNIKLYPSFEHELAMAIGDEFDSDSIHAYQLADFAEECQLKRSLVVKQLKHVINKLQFALNHLTNKYVNNDEEKKFLAEYKTIVQKRCEYLFNQADEIHSIQL